MTDLISVFIWVMKVPISIRNMIPIIGKILSQKMCILMKLNVMIKKILSLDILLMIREIKKMMSFLQISHIFGMLVGQILS